ncbi:BZ3500_MvSof-1268-A1-R1_Chr12-2g03812 [Microbotryum saponariae]|uniref:BZ3500_MvSof-1268-A1-R1_Chr12-2g03812 protein n=1 Tax=Microbotryum saponariae TaxID=289078 RepID=A0A2X0KL59_9BASI|nr:BZ3500_MvSof-1268-A1-R1_Chr12-2g03812 [Microbotryum saponariae]
MIVKGTVSRQAIFFFIRDYLGPQTALGTHCKAGHGKCERTKSTGHFSTSCSQGKVQLPPPPQPNFPEYLNESRP